MLDIEIALLFSSDTEDEGGRMNILFNVSKLTVLLHNFDVPDLFHLIVFSSISFY